MKNTLKVKLLPRVADYSFEKEFGKETGQKCKVSYLHSLKEIKTLNGVVPEPKYKRCNLDQLASWLEICTNILPSLISQKLTRFQNKQIQQKQEQS